MPLTKLNGFLKKIGDLPDKPTPGSMSAADLKAYFDSSPEELRLALNKLIDELEATGASNIGTSPIAGLAGTKVQDLLSSLKTYVDGHMNNASNPHNVTAAQINTYTKDELAPYLQGGDTLIKYEVFTIVTSNNGNGTFFYNDTNSVQRTGTVTAEGYQTFTLLNGQYGIGANRIECTINDTLQRSVASGGLVEVDSTHVTLTSPEGAGAEITFKYFERIGITGEHNIVLGTVIPPISDGNTMWFKVV